MPSPCLYLLAARAAMPRLELFPFTLHGFFCNNLCCNNQQWSGLYCAGRLRPWYETVNPKQLSPCRCLEVSLAQSIYLSAFNAINRSVCLAPTNSGLLKMPAILGTPKARSVVTLLLPCIHLFARRPLQLLHAVSHSDCITRDLSPQVVAACEFFFVSLQPLNTSKSSASSANATRRFGL